jgi:hypothetical protein
VTRSTLVVVLLLCAALVAVVCGFAVAVGVDWMWELTAVSVAAVVSLALVVCAATLPRPLPGSGVRLGMSPHGRLVAIGGLAVAAVLGVVGGANQLLAQTKLDSSQSATAKGRLESAWNDALDARDLQPWAASPYLQLALVAEQQAKLGTALSAIEKATDRAPDDWRLWLVRSRLETKSGMVKAGVESLRRARKLNPRSPLFDAG